MPSIGLNMFWPIIIIFNFTIRYLPCTRFDISSSIWCTHFTEDLANYYGDFHQAFNFAEWEINHPLNVLSWSSLNFSKLCVNKFLDSMKYCNFFSITEISDKHTNLLLLLHNSLVLSCSYYILHRQRYKMDCFLGTFVFLCNEMGMWKG